jgi:RNA binding exosome subunit
MKIVKMFFILLMFLTVAETTFGGICLEYKPSVVNFYESEAVFIGKILNIKRFYGIKKTEENWSLKYRIVEFEILEDYKGIKAGNKISVINSYGNIDWEDLKLKKGQRWAIYAKRYNRNLIFGTGCSAWSELVENEVDFAEWNDFFSSLKKQIESDKQAIIGRVFDTHSYNEIENAEINIEGNNEKFFIKTDKQGLYYLPVNLKGSYTISIKLPVKSIFYYNSFEVEKKQIEEIYNKNTFTYKINLESGEFNYNELTVGLLK